MATEKPILSVYEVKRAALAALSQEKLPQGIITADHNDHQARLIARASFMHKTEFGPVNRSIQADLFARGEDHVFTKDRGIEAIIKSTDADHPFALRYSIQESESGISYILRSFQGRKLTRVFDYAVGVNFAFTRVRNSPHGSITRTDLILTPSNKQDLSLIEDFTAALLQPVEAQPVTSR